MAFARCYIPSDDFEPRNGMRNRVLQTSGELLGMLPFALEILNNPEFVEEIRAVAAQLLDGGDGFLGTMKPANPVSLVQIAAGGATAPGVLLQLLNVEVEAQ